MIIIEKLKCLKKFKSLSEKDGRTWNIIKNTLMSILAKSSNILCSLLIIPLTIDYVNPDQYGVWISISSIIGWITFFDLGLGNGFRNKFVKAKACGNQKLCQQYVSTTYFSIGFIVILIWILAIICNFFLNWSSILNVSKELNPVLRSVFVIVSFFTCLQMIVNLFLTLLTADLRPGLASILGAIGQISILLLILILKKHTDGSLSILAFVFSGVPCIVILIASVIMFYCSRYRIYRPSIKNFKYVLIRDILNLGSRFFIIYLCLIVIFQIINLIISREIGSYAVTQYNIVNKYFSVIYMIVNIMMATIWSSVTDAYERDDIHWLRNLNKRLEKCFWMSCFAYIFLLIISPIVYKIWIGEMVEIPDTLSCVMVLSFICQTLAAIYINQLNGFGKLKIQTIVYVLFALISWPLFINSAKLLGLYGIVLVPALVWLIQGIIAKIQVKKILNNSAYGIWNE